MKELMGELERVEAELRSASAVVPAPPPPAAEESHPDTEQNEIVSVPRTRAGLYATALGVGAVVLAVTLMALSGGSKKKPPASLPVAVPPAAAKALEPAAPAAPEPVKAERSDVEIVLRTVPPGAEIYDGEALIGASPLTFRRARAEGAVNLTFRRAGFREVTREVVPDRDRDLEVVLMAKPKSAPPPRTATPVAPPQEAPEPAATRPAPRPAEPKRVSDLRNPFE